MAEPATKPTDPASYRLFEGSTVLVVEDQGDSRDMMRQMLEALGLRVFVAEDGQQALGLLEEEAPDLILCDLLMPRIDGFTLVERLRSDPRRRATPVVAVTGLGYDSDYQRTWVAGFDGHLVKPIDIEIVIETLRRYLPSGARRALRGSEARASGRTKGRART